MLLQAAPSPIPSMGIFETLTQYGALGVITLGLGAVLWFLLKRQIASEDRLKHQVEDLQKEINNYIRTDQGQMKSVIENNTKAIQEMRDIVIAGSVKSRR